MTLLTVSGLQKAYAGAVALRNASLELAAGETLALMGENGAGKSTLIKILAGAVAPDGGDVRLDGAPIAVRSPDEAHRLGFRFIHQELNVVPGLSVAENLFLGRAYPRRLGLVDWGALNERARDALKTLGVEHVAPQTIVSRLPVGDRMLVKIAAAFLEDGAPARVFVMDEPTAALTAEESQRLFRIIEVLRERGCGVIYVSHRLDEVLAIADRITVLRDGETRATLTAGEATKTRLIELMIGREASEAASPAGPSPEARIALKVEALNGHGLADVAFELKRGEILGVAGLADSGAERLTRALVESAGRGRLTLDGAPLTLDGPADAWAKGFALAPRERRAEGLLLMQSIADNIALPHLRRFARARWFVNRAAERARAHKTGERVRLKASSPLQKTRTLSGGNQQKVMFARAVAGAPRVLLLDEPTRGVDVGAKFDIYALIEDLAAAGTSAIVVSTDQEELLRLCSRIVVMRAGRSAATVSTLGMTPQRLLALCYGETMDA
jgi:ABC-type sugar transport system ATPase subunit